MRSPVASQRRTFALNVPAPVRGINAITSLMAMKPADALVLDNFVCYPDRIQIRDGWTPFVTDFAKPVQHLWTHSSTTGVNTLWATTDDGVFSAGAAGVCPSAAIALTDGDTIGVNISTGGTNCLMLVNGVDTLKKYNGSAWSSVATFGATATSTYSYVEVYKQRLWMIQKNSLTMEYLPPNSISGTPITYDLGAIFRRGGKLVALGTWTIDGGTGSDDHLVVVTSEGEIAVFAGNDPASSSTWALIGVFFVSRPLGKRCLYKYAGDLLYLSDAGLFPLSKALLVASIDRTQAISEKIRPMFNAAAQLFRLNSGWQMVAQPEIPLLIVNIPSTPVRRQFVMHLQTGAWSTFSGLEANCFAQADSVLFMGTDDGVVKITGTDDNGAFIFGTMQQAYSMFGFPENKTIKEIKPTFSTEGQFTYDLGVADDFDQNYLTNTVAAANFATVSIWGTGVWGTSTWNAGASTIRNWITVPNTYSQWKSIYCRTSSLNGVLSYLGSDALMQRGSFW